ncbi:MAG: copper homeostasis protein CutC [Muribaculaceae bacterium]
MATKYTLEVCAGDIESALAAQRGGATRIELCSALSEGGVTPSAGLAAEAAQLGLTVHALIRVRGGDFLYTDAEVNTMVSDIRMFKQLGIDGVVIGALTADGDIDMDACRRMADAAQGINITFHRAFDRCRDPQKALEQIISLGCNRLLTSGQAPTAQQGIATIADLVKQANGRIAIMPGCGVNAQNVAQILTATGATEIHASASATIASGMRYHRSQVYMGAKGADEENRRSTSEAAVKDIINAINGIS